jgi:hypothetical protein
MIPVSIRVYPNRVKGQFFRGPSAVCIGTFYEVVPVIYFSTRGGFITAAKANK